MNGGIAKESTDRKGDKGKDYVIESFGGELFGTKDEDKDSRHDEAKDRNGKACSDTE